MCLHSGEFAVRKIATEINPADVFTKPLAGSKYHIVVSRVV
jgi:hypothetical protein